MPECEQTRKRQIRTPPSQNQPGTFIYRHLKYMHSNLWEELTRTQEHKGTQIHRAEKSFPKAKWTTAYVSMTQHPDERIAIA